MQIEADICTSVLWYIIKQYSKLSYLLKLLNRCSLIGTIKTSLHLPQPYPINTFLLNTREVLNLHFSNIFYFIFLKINSFPIWYVMGKERRMSSSKGGFELVDRIKSYQKKVRSLRLTLLFYCVFCNFVYPNQTVVGGVSICSLCQQGGLFALSVNRHPININISDYLNVKALGGPLKMQGPGQLPALYCYAFCSQIYLSENILVKRVKCIHETQAANFCANCSWNHSYIIFEIHLISITNATISIWMDLRTICLVCSAHVSWMRPTVYLNMSLHE